MVPILYILSGPDRDRLFRIAEGTSLLISSSPTADIRVVDDSASTDLSLCFENGQLRASFSEVPTGQVARSRSLQTGEILEFGNHELWVLDAILSGYSLGSKIAHGRFGVVFNAHDSKGHHVAIKILKPAAVKGPTAEKRFKRAMETMLGKRHSNLVTVLAAQRKNSLSWFAMEYVNGPSLKQLMKKGAAGMMEWPEALRVVTDVAKALHFIHERGIIHRNLSPANVILTNEGTAKLGDATLAKALEGPRARSVTGDGELVGDPRYMSPERTLGPKVDARSDIYSLGALFYELLSGRPPFVGPTDADILAQVRAGNPVSPKLIHMSIHDDVEYVIMKMLAKDPSQRHQTASELLASLAPLSSH